MSRIPHLTLAMRLYLAIAAAVMITFFASFISWNAFTDLGQRQSIISRVHLPAITTALQLAEQSARVASVAPELLTARNELQRQSILVDIHQLRQEIAALAGKLESILANKAQGFDYAQLEEILRNKDTLFDLLDEYAEIVQKQLQLKTTLADQVSRASATTAVLRGIILSLVDDQWFYILTGYQSLDDKSPQAKEKRLNVNSIQQFAALSDLAAESNLLAGLLREASISTELAHLSAVGEKIHATESRFKAARDVLSDSSQTLQLDDAFRTITFLASGEKNILKNRQKILQQQNIAQQILRRSSMMSEKFSADIKTIVASARQRTLVSVEEAEHIIEVRGMQLIWLNGLVVLGAALLGWLYVKRSFTVPISHLTSSAEEFEHGKFQQDSLKGIAARNDELGHLARSFTNMAIEVQLKTDHLDSLVSERTRQLDEKNDALQKTLGKISDELDMARGMQLSILPQSYPINSRLSFHAHMLAAREIGGDFYDIIELNQDQTAVVIADVSDKGVPAALMMAVACTQLRSIALRELSPDRVIEKLNNSLCEENDDILFVTLFYAVINTRTGILTYVNAGHEPPFIVSEKHGARKIPLTGGIALGVSQGISYQQNTIQLVPDDVLFCYTDGITEAFNCVGQAFSTGRLADTLADSYTPSVQRLCDRILLKVDQHVDGAQQSDDIACLAVSLVAEHNAVTTKASEFSVRLKPDLSEISEFANRFQAFAESWSISGKIIKKINLSLDELLTNIIEYGFNSTDDANIEIYARMLEGGISIVVEDNGIAFNPTDIKPADMNEPLETRKSGGLGIHIARTFMDSIEYVRDEGKNQLKLFKKITSGK